MLYTQIYQASFLSRPNRFIARVLLDGQEVVCHVKNTGRLQELLRPGASVYLERANRPGRKTLYDLVAVEKNGQIINIDSQAPNAAVAEWLQSGGLFSDPALIRREVRFKQSRFDFYLETVSGGRAFLEVKGVTLLEDGIARFPDAPTLRGIKHIEELMDCVSSGYEAYLLFLLELKGARCMEPNDQAQLAFGCALRRAAVKGVQLLAYDCHVTPNSLSVDQAVPIIL